MEHRADDVEPRSAGGPARSRWRRTARRDSATRAPPPAALGEWCSVCTIGVGDRRAERERHRVVGRFVVDDVELGRPLDRGRRGSASRTAPTATCSGRASSRADRSRAAWPWSSSRRSQTASRRGPRATSPSVSSDVMDSTEPDFGGGIVVATGATWAMRSGAGRAQRTRPPAAAAGCGGVEVLAGDLAGAMRAWRS